MTFGSFQNFQIVSIAHKAGLTVAGKGKTSYFNGQKDSKYDFGFELDVCLQELDLYEVNIGCQFNAHWGSTQRWLLV